MQMMPNHPSCRRRRARVPHAWPQNRSAIEFITIPFDGHVTGTTLTRVLHDRLCSASLKGLSASHGRAGMRQSGPEHPEVQTAGGSRMSTAIIEALRAKLGEALAASELTFPTFGGRGLS